MNRLLPIKPTPRVLRQFAGAWLIFFFVLSATALGKKHNAPLSCAFAIVALFGIVGLIKPGAVRVPFIVSSVVAYPVGWLMSQIILAAMFYGVITPVGLFWRIRGRDPLQLRGQPKQPTFWIKRGSQPAPDRYLKPF
jgi:Saxitoxin biosynthesis operon protein SxtJ